MENINLLVEKSRGGDRDAFARIVEQYQGMVSAVTLNIVGDYAQSEDLAQETFLTAWKKLPELREPDKTASWFYGIAKRVALHWRQRQQKNPLLGAAELDDQTLADHQSQAETERRRQQEQSLELVWSTVKELPEIFREPLLLYYRYSKSTADIAASMELTEEAVRQRLSRGRKMLKAEVEKQVESVLESTRPDTAFTLAVLASLPLAATASGCTATGIGAAAGTQTGCLGWFGWVLLGIFAPIIVITGGFMGLWTALKHSPTIRTRRFMCLAALQWYVFIWLFMLAKLYVDNKHGGWHIHGGAFFFSFYVILLVFCSWLVYRWRMLLEEDAGLQPMSDKPLEKTSLSLFRLLCWYLFSLLPILVLSTIMLLDIFGELYRRPAFASLSDARKITSLTISGLFWMSIPLGFFVVIGYGIRMARDESSLARWYPRRGKAFLPKPEAATHWKLFWRDIVVMFTTTLFPMIPLVMSGMIAGGVAFWTFLSTMMMVVASLIASHSAGIPGKRLRGYAQLFLFTGLFYTVMILLGKRRIEASIPIGFGLHVAPLAVFSIVYFGAALTAFLCRSRHSRP